MMRELFAYKIYKSCSRNTYFQISQPLRQRKSGAAKILVSGSVQKRTQNSLKDRLGMMDHLKVNWGLAYS